MKESESSVAYCNEMVYLERMQVILLVFEIPVVLELIPGLIICSQLLDLNTD